MHHIKKNLENLRKIIIDCEKRFQRKPASVKLLAVSKNHPISAIREAALAGQLAFAENYLQEALEKIQTLQDLNLEWHFIGHIQSNKTRKIAENFSWIHSISDEKIAKRLSEQRPSHLPPLNICLEVNIDNEANKSGINLSKISELALSIQTLPHLKLRGLMAIPKVESDMKIQRVAFAKLHKALENLQHIGLSVDTLSMGMSDDFIAAIAEGATIIRIGTAIFGPRSSLQGSKF